MTKKTNNRLTLAGRRLAKRLLVVQAAATVFFVVFFAWLYGASGAKTAFAGGIISLVPNTVFAVYAFRFGGARSASEVVRSFYAGEAVKMVLTMVLFALAFITLSGPWLPLFIVFSVVTFMHWLIPFLNFKSN
ncbi:ATP synthase subunit I [Aliidiomarina quisquiliarum]|uniref:ATP synthase subunit I n=1 Tax=Aliidiomarina quisquiliarum TaxID=2938947 RepID=UPI00208DFB8C|nr:ATP synthase subunit I [Aliidiomarina quisquiliarum]MCO4321257.1 ATP synthase subunit I [Aliidiomarina quisquiliarum]